MEPISRSITVLKTVKLNLWSTVSRVRGFKGFAQLQIRKELGLNEYLRKSTSFISTRRRSRILVKILCWTIRYYYRILCEVRCF